MLGWLAFCEGHVFLQGNWKSNLPEWEECKEVAAASASRMSRANVGKPLGMQYVCHNTLPIFCSAAVAKEDANTYHLALPVTVDKIYPSDEFVGKLTCYLFQKSGFNILSCNFVNTKTDEWVNDIKVLPMEKTQMDLEFWMERYYSLLKKREDPMPNYGYCSRCFGKDNCRFFNPNASVIDMGAELGILTRV